MNTKNIIITIVAVLCANGAFWLFNHINAWLGIAALFVVSFALGWHINREINNANENDNEKSK